MAKLTKAQANQLQSILSSLNWGRDYIMHPETEVARHTRYASTILEYTHPADNTILYTINKHIGSPLCGIHTAKERLEQFIRANC